MSAFDVFITLGSENVYSSGVDSSTVVCGNGNVHAGGCCGVIEVGVSLAGIGSGVNAKVAVLGGSDVAIGMGEGDVVHAVNTRTRKPIAIFVFMVFFLR